MKETQTAVKAPQAGTTVPDLRKVQEYLQAAATQLDSAVSKLDELPANHSRAIWKSIIIPVKEDINRYAVKLLELLSGTPKADKS